MGSLNWIMSQRGKNGRNNYLQLMSILLRNFERMMLLRPSGTRSDKMRWSESKHSSYALRLFPPFIYGEYQIYFFLWHSDWILPRLARRLEPFNMPHDPRILIKVLGPAIVNVLYFSDSMFISVVFSYPRFPGNPRWRGCEIFDKLHIGGIQGDIRINESFHPQTMYYFICIFFNRLFIFLWLWFAGRG